MGLELLTFIVGFVIGVLVISFDDDDDNNSGAAINTDIKIY